jgi:NAD(P)H-flavin reductase
VPWNLYEHRLFTQLDDRPWFTYTGAVSDDSSYPGQRGLVGSVAARSEQWRGRAAFVCGSNAMVEHTVRELTTAGMPPEDIRVEQFDDVTRKPLSRTR